MDEEEKKKIRSVLKDQGKSQPLEWMYKGEKPELEDYLLGKRVDRHVEEEPPKEDGVGALFGERIQANIELDMKAKIREDPLFAIRQKEEDVKKKLLQNPVKMKRLQKKLEEEKKKQKKSKEVHHGHKSTSGDDDILQKYLSILSKKNKVKSGKHSEKDFKKHKYDLNSDSHKEKQKHLRNDKHKHGSETDSSDDSDYKQSRYLSYKANVYKHREDSSFSRRDNKDRRHDRDFVKRMRRHDSEFSDEGERQREQNYRLKHRKDNDSSENETRHKKIKKHKNKHRNNSDQGENESSKRHSKQHKTKHRHYSDSSDSDNACDRKYFRKDVKSEHTRKGVSHEQHLKSGKKEVNAERLSRDESSDSSRDSSSDESENVPKKQYGLIVRSDHIPTHQRSRSPQPLRSKKRSRTPERSRSPRRHHSRSKSPETRTKTYKTVSSRKSPERKPVKPRKLTDEEKKKKLERMMENAQWREEQRTKNVKHYEDEDRKESESLKKNSETGAEFLNPLMSSHADKSSVEDRIKRNRFNIQRTKADLDRDFLKK